MAEESVAIFNTLGCVCPVSCAPFQVVVFMSVYKRTRLAHSLKNRYLNSENSLSSMLSSPFRLFGTHPTHRLSCQQRWQP